MKNNSVSTLKISLKKLIDSKTIERLKKKLMKDSEILSLTESDIDILMYVVQDQTIEVTFREKCLIELCKLAWPGK